MSDAIKPIVNAQVNINRAVWEANRPHPRVDYLLAALKDANEWLVDAREMLTRQKKTNERKHKQ